LVSVCFVEVVLLIKLLVYTVLTIKYRQYNYEGETPFFGTPDAGSF